jgi:hypothetical protein
MDPGIVLRYAARSAEKKKRKLRNFGNGISVTNALFLRVG